MSVWLIVAWMVVGVLTVPWVIGAINRRGDSMERDPALETFVGVCFGPIPLVMFAGYFVLRAVGRVVYRLTGQTTEAES